MLRIAHLFLKFESLFIMDFFNTNLIFLKITVKYDLS